MIYYRCRICQPSAVPVEGEVYTTEWSGICHRCGCEMTLVRIMGIRKPRERAETQGGAKAPRRDLAAIRDAAIKAAHDVDEDDGAEAERPRAVRASEMEESEPIDHMASGEPGIDCVAGKGGWARGHSYGLHGPPGAGKGRLARLAAVLACRYGNVMIASTTHEESSKMVKLHLEAGRHKGVPYMQLPHVRKRLILLPNADDVDDIAEEAIANKVVLLISDSITTMGARRQGIGRQPQIVQKYAASLLCQIAEPFNMTTVTILQETNEGHAAGGKYLLHMFEAVLRMDRMYRREYAAGWSQLEVCSDDALFGGIVRFRPYKNRFAAPASALYKQHDTGLLTCNEQGEPVHEPEKSPAARTQGRTRVRNAASTRSRA